MANSLEIYIDGASKGNPGPSGIGVVIREDGRELKCVSRFIGHATNNVAEYSALISALEEGLILKATRLSIKTDSELLHRQITKVYKVRSASILGLYEQALRLISGFASVAVCHVPREQNAQADKLATKAIKEHCALTHSRQAGAATR